jgi:hypothetical protein
MLGQASTVVRNTDLITAAVGDEVAMLNINSGSYFILDDIGAAIWDRLQAPTTPAHICESLRQQFDVPLAQCEADVLTFLRELHAKGLLTVVD